MCIYISKDLLYMQIPYLEFELFQKKKNHEGKEEKRRRKILSLNSIKRSFELPKINIKV